MTIRTFLQAVLCSLLFSLGLGTSAAQTLSFAVVPQFPPEEIFRDWTPVLEAISKLSGLDFKLKTYASIPDFEAAVLNGEPDVVYMNPYHVVMAKKAAGYTPILRNDAKRLTGILVVRRDSALTRVKQLDGATLAFPSPNAFGASLYMRALLTNEQKIHFTPVFVTTHSNVFRYVISGRAQAGGSIRSALAQETPELQAQLRVVYETPSVYSHPIATHPRVKAEVRRALQQAFLKLGENPAYAEQLKNIQIPKPVAADYKEYAPLEKLGLEHFVIIKNK